MTKMYYILAALLLTSSFAKCFVLQPLDPALLGCCPRPNPCLCSPLHPPPPPPTTITVAPCMDLLTKLKAKLCSKLCGKTALALHPYIKSLAPPPCAPAPPPCGCAPPPPPPCAYPPPPLCPCF